MILECIGLVTWGCNVKMCVGLCSFVAAALFQFFYFALDMYSPDRDSRHSGLDRILEAILAYAAQEEEQPDGATEGNY